MFDLNREIQKWRAPFQASHLYSSGDLSELEAHLRDAIESERLRGASEEKSFRAALKRVGDEPTLRGQYQLGWTDLGPLRKTWRLMTGEASGFKTEGSRIGYGSARVVSLLVGLVAWLYLVAAGNFLLNGFKLIEFGRPVYEQGVLITALFGAQGVFNWIPFGPWRNRLGDWVRLAVSVASLYVALVFLFSHPDTYTGLAGFVGIVSMSTAFSIGPLLWVLQVIVRRQLFVDYEDLLLSSR